MKRSANSRSSWPTKNKTSAGLAAGAAVVEITPPLEVGLLMSSVEERWAPFQSVRTPLNARVLVLESAGERVALLALDLLGLHSKAVGGWQQFKRALARATSGSVAADRIVISCTHTHSAPESSAVTNLYQTTAFRAWVAQLIDRIGQTIRAAAANLQPCILDLGVTELRGYSLQRRVLRGGRIVMSDALQPIAPDLMNREPSDHRVHALWLRRVDGSNIATVVHAVCHPVHEMCWPQVSADFPGELCSALEKVSDGVPIFFNGAAGDTNPPTVSGGPETARRHGVALAEAVVAVAPRARRIKAEALGFSSRMVKLPMRSMKGTDARATISAHLAALRLGPLALLFLPGEIFVETAQQIEKGSLFDQTLVIGFAANSVGYVPTPRAFREGGYEIGPGKWSFLQQSAEPLIQREASAMLQELFWKAPAAQGVAGANRTSGAYARI